MEILRYGDFSFYRFPVAKQRKTNKKGNKEQKTNCSKRPSSFFFYGKQAAVKRLDFSGNRNCNLNKPNGFY